ncbi:hypothetical protein ACK3SF_02395 [Candidatus Nanosalina sp. VS9-1]|uniref:hypothetical protein n=1 Tax=Candidatus Nanosalina sp. VS9-1 TaxID=3388566 RepID=UPI0039DF9F8C
MELGERIKANRVGGLVYRHSLLGVLAVTRILQRVKYPVPNHWKQFLETLQVTSEVAYSRIILTDSEVEEEFKEKQEKIENLKDRNLHSDEEIQKICQEREARGL